MLPKSGENSPKRGSKTCAPPGPPHAGFEGGGLDLEQGLFSRPPFSPMPPRTLLARSDYCYPPRRLLSIAIGNFDGGDGDGGGGSGGSGTNSFTMCLVAVTVAGGGSLRSNDDGDGCHGKY